MELSRVIAEMEKIAPPSLAASFDAGRIGTIIRGSEEVERIAVALDPTWRVISWAEEIQARLLITHHTLIWNPVNKIDAGLASKLKMLLRGNISLYCAHTNWDAAPGGVNETYARALGMNYFEPADNGMAVVGRIPGNMRGGQYAEFIGEALDCRARLYGNPKKLTRHIVAVAGSGFRSALDLAKTVECDTVVSSELHHDQIREAEDLELNLIEVPHYSAEFPAMESLAERLRLLDIEVKVLEDDPGCD